MLNFLNLSELSIYRKFSKVTKYYNLDKNEIFKYDRTIGLNYHLIALPNYSFVKSGYL